MRAFRLLFLRRLIAACLAVSLGFFSAESLTAEVHDGDATHAELVRTDGAREHSAAHRAAVVAEATHNSNRTLRAVSGTGVDTTSGHTHGGPSSNEGAPAHSAHACHCGHGHLAPVSLAVAAPRSAFGVERLATAEEPAAPLSRAGEPALRPPIG